MTLTYIQEHSYVKYWNQPKTCAFSKSLYPSVFMITTVCCARVCVFGVGGRGGGEGVQYPAVHFLCLQYIYLYYTFVLRLEFGHVWLLPTSLFTEIAACKFSLNFLYFAHCVCLYIFLFLFVRRIVP